MAALFSLHHNTMLRLAGAVSILALAAPGTMLAQTPGLPPASAEIVVQTIHPNGVLTPQLRDLDEIMVTGDGQMAFVPLKNTPQLATDGRGSLPHEAQDSIDPGAAPGLASAP
jgi:hypothetical protein